jgi:hypothetical protein
VYLAVCDDDLPEPDETFIFHLTLQVSSSFPLNLKLIKILQHLKICFTYR